MAYTKTNWQNGATPAINADNLNHMEQGIYDADPYDGTFDSQINLLEGKWNPAGGLAQAVEYTYTLPADGYLIGWRDAHGAGNIGLYAMATNGTGSSGTFPGINISSGDGNTKGQESVYLKKGTRVYIQSIAPTSSYVSDVHLLFRPYKFV